MNPCNHGFLQFAGLPASVRVTQDGRHFLLFVRRRTATASEALKDIFQELLELQDGSLVVYHSVCKRYVRTLPKIIHLACDHGQADTKYSTFSAVYTTAGRLCSGHVMCTDGGTVMDLEFALEEERPWSR